MAIWDCQPQQYVNCELPDVQAVLEKAEEPEIKLPTSIESLKKQESSRKTSALIFIISLLVLFLGLACSCFSSSLSCKVRLLISDLSDLFLRLFLNL